MLRGHSTPPHTTAKPRQFGRALFAACLALGALIVLAAATPSHAATISAGGGHTCAVATSGSVQCWGQGDVGQLGNGQTTRSVVPVTVAGITDATEVAAGAQHSCALRSSGTVVCWGRNELGSLGDATGVDSSTPVAAVGVTDAIAIAVSRYISCALIDGGEVQCWGQIPRGQPGSSGLAYAPVSLPYLGRVDDVAVADGEICGITSTRTRCFTYWIDRGDGSAQPSSTEIELEGSEAIQARFGSAVWGGCSLLASGQVSCEGYNHVGQLGNGVTGNQWGNDRMPRGRSLALGITDARAIALVGGGACALIDDGHVECWGPTFDGIPTDGGPGSELHLRPEPRVDLESIRAITGNGHGCAVDQQGVARCWGVNYAGQLGNGTLIPSPTPRVVEGLEVKVSARDAVTPVRSGEPDITVPAPPVAGTTPVPTTPRPTTPRPTTPTSGAPNQGSSPQPAPLAVPTAQVAGRWLVLTDLRVPNRGLRSCAATALVTAGTGQGRNSRHLPVTRQPSGACTVSGSVRLSSRLAKAKRVRVSIRQRGGRSVVKTVTIAKR